MPAHTPMALPAPSMDPDDDAYDLSDEQMQTLLKEAEVRLGQRQAKAKDSSTDLAQFHTALVQFHTALPKLDVGKTPKPYVNTSCNIAHADATKLVPQRDRILANAPRKVEDPVVVRKRNAEERKATAGPQWFNLPKTNLAPELKRDLQLLKMRSVLDPKRHYKKEGGKLKPPEYSQVGQIIEGPAEFYSSRLPNKERKKTFVEEVLAGEAETGRFKRKYEEIQKIKTSGKKAHYKALKAKRAKKFR